MENTDPMLMVMTKILEELHDQKQKKGAAISEKYGQKRTTKCWKCGVESHYQCNCKAYQDQWVRNVTRKTKTWRSHRAEVASKLKAPF